eukprot:SAG11_NODE_702_length_7661_cov_3.468659_5_plen_151_part_00
MANDLEVQEKPVAHATAAAAAGSGVKAHRVSTGDSIGQHRIPATLHLFVDHQGLEEVSGLELVEHRPFKTYDVAVEPSEPWDGGLPPVPRTLLPLRVLSRATLTAASSRRTRARAHRGLLIGGPGVALCTARGPEACSVKKDLNLLLVDF